ncbi:WD40 repeat-like protein [Sistotremastrum suecicum HHB10207 ss-3]|uniref:WD40 repeat-like protein n=1 Tax=Sistotremastrum suecicum HHB10207 ss-3 TaxID=1314776 RepID=A0A166IDM9_9AGAM|nr:WD40 repeat-like protein [Sistotremastrum suecicum HHB10207 ss-3]
MSRASKLPEINLAHPEGPTHLAFSRDGSLIYSGGRDSIVRLWRAELGTDQEPDVAIEAEEAITGIATSKSYWFGASEDAHVRYYKAGSKSMEGLVARTAGVPIRHISVDPEEKRIAVASDDLSIKIIDIEEPENVSVLTGYPSAARKISWHPDGKILIASCMDGVLVVWDTENHQQITKIEGLISPVTDTSAPEFDYDCSALWDPLGESFFLASKSHDVVSISKNGWAKVGAFSDTENPEAVTALALSPNGLYLAAAMQSKQVVVFSIANRKPVARQTSEGIPTCLEFSPTHNLLAWTSTDGSISRWRSVIPPTMSSPVERRSKPVEKATEGIFEDSANDAFDDNDDNGNEDDWIIDDLDTGHVELPKAKPVDPYAREMVNVTKAQSPFQSGSTPMRNKKRYLAFNAIGVISVTDQETHHVVNIEFHDRSSKKGFHFQDYLRYNIGSLGEQGALFACPPEAGHPAQVTYKGFSSWSPSTEWTYEFPESEHVVAVATCGTHQSKSTRDSRSPPTAYGIVATNKGYLRFFTAGGIQKYIWAVGDDIVSMVGGHECLLVVHRAGGTSLDGSQNLRYSLISLINFDVLQEGLLPLPRGKILKWIGFSADDAPLAHDNSGVLYLLDRFRRPKQGRWTPLLDTNMLARKQGKDESYWPIGLSGDNFMCLILKGREEHPGFPQPLVQELPIQLPLLTQSTPEAALEEKVYRDSMFVGLLQDSLGDKTFDQDIARQELAVDKTLLQLIQPYCKADDLQRALDAIYMLRHDASLNAAAKLANFYLRPGLEEKIQKLRHERGEQNPAEQARAERIGWRNHAPPIPASRPSTSEFDTDLHDEYQCGSIAPKRKALKPANPSSDSSSPFSLNTAKLSTDISPSDQVDVVEEQIPSQQNGKRKLDDSDLSAADWDTVQQNKRPFLQSADRLSQSQGSKQKPAVNPFARKAAATSSSSASASAPNARSLAKSSSFFDKVESLDTGKSGRTGQKKGTL